MKLLQAIRAYKALVDELKSVPKGNADSMKRHDLGKKVREAAQTADYAAEVLREWLEDAENLESKWYVMAGTLYKAWTGARKDYKEWLKEPTNGNLAKMRISEKVLFQTVDAIIAKQKQALAATK